MTVPPDPNSPDSAEPRPEPGDVTPPELPAWAGSDQGASAAPGLGASAGYGQGPYGAYAGSTTAPLSPGPAPVLVSFPPPASQSRVTIAFRLLLAVPHLIVLWALTIAAEVIVVIGWFAALFTGRLPEWAHIFLAGVLRWQVRVYSYLFFVTGAYPPFSLDDEPYPIRLVTQRTPLNRLAVLFRLFLLIPAAIVAGLATYGLGVLSFFLWLIALIMGRLPRPLHYAVASIVRYQVRYYGYAGMVTGEYPKGLYVDGPADQPDAAGDPWRLPLSNGPRPIIGAFMLVGCAALFLQIFLPATQSGNNPATIISNAAGLIQVGQAYDKLTSNTVKFESATQACGGQLSCVTAQDRKEAGYLQAFANAVKSAGLQGQPVTDATKLISDADASAQSLDTLATATTAAQYESDLTATGVEGQLNSIDGDYQKLIHDLTGSS